jgi:hypothetical protein
VNDVDNRLDRLARTLRRVAGVSNVEVEPYPSGEVFVTVWVGERCFGLSHDPNNGTQVYDVAEQTLDVGPYEHFPRLDDAASRLIELVREHAPLREIAAG